MTNSTLEQPRIASREEWLQARKQLLLKEKELTRAHDELRRQRSLLPWVPVDKTYEFDSPAGKLTLADLFAGRSQLVIQHFMLGPGWKEGCVGCSFAADHVGGALVHLENHDVSFAVVSRAPLAEIQVFQKRMGWNFRWVSSYDSDFNYDYHVSFPKKNATESVYYNFETQPFTSDELPGISVFAQTGEGMIFHTYSCYARGAEQSLGAYFYLDLTPKGRDENGPRHDLTDWVRHHDRYGAGGSVDAGGRYQAPVGTIATSCCHDVAD